MINIEYANQEMFGNTNSLIIIDARATMVGDPLHLLTYPWLANQRSTSSPKTAKGKPISTIREI
jgi:hypothetical protein